MGCHTLSKVQSKSVADFAKDCSLIAEVPISVHKKIHDFENFEINKDLESRIADIDVRELNNELKKSFDLLKYNDSVTNEFNIKYLIFIKISELLLVFTDGKYSEQFSKSVNDGAPVLNNLITQYNSTQSKPARIPKSIGSLVGEITTAAGQRKLKWMQRKYLVKFINASDTLFTSITDDFISGDYPSMINQHKNLVKGEAIFFPTYVQDLKRNDSANINHPEYLQEHVIKVYKGRQLALENINTLIGISLKNMQTLKNTFDKIKVSLNTKLSLKEQYEEFKELNLEAAKIKSIYKKFEEQRNELHESENYSK